MPRQRLDIDDASDGGGLCDGVLLESGGGAECRFVQRSEKPLGIAGDFSGHTGATQRAG